LEIRPPLCHYKRGGDNQLRFDIEARIQDDASDGINEARMRNLGFEIREATGETNFLIG